jgi:predicted aldo/keto reductase-like oxidoreductase
MTTFDQIAENTSVGRDLAFTEEERKSLVQGEAQGGLYCNACERCVPGCPKGLPIPELMRAFMYAYGYGSPALGRELVAAAGVRPDPCSGCASCTASCVKRFDVRERIRDVSRLAAVPEEFLS